jgi:hypothetical protein
MCVDWDYDIGNSEASSLPSNYVILLLVFPRQLRRHFAHHKLLDFIF